MIVVFGLMVVPIHANAQVQSGVGHGFDNTVKPVTPTVSKPVTKNPFQGIFDSIKRFQTDQKARSDAQKQAFNHIKTQDGQQNTQKNMIKKDDLNKGSIQPNGLQKAISNLQAKIWSVSNTSTVSGGLRGGSSGISHK